MSTIHTPAAPVQRTRHDAGHEPRPHIDTDLLEAARAYRWPGGKHAGKLLADLDEQFLRWVISKTWDDHIREMAEAVLQFREAEAIATKFRKRLAPKSLDELLYLLIQSHERIDSLEKRLRYAEEKISDLRGEDRS